MKRYEVTGRPLDSATLATCAIGDIVNLDLEPELEAGLVSAGAIRALPEPKAKPEPVKDAKE